MRLTLALPHRPTRREQAPASEHGRHDRRGLVGRAAAASRWSSWMIAMRRRRCGSGIAVRRGIGGARRDAVRRRGRGGGAAELPCVGWRRTRRRGREEDVERVATASRHRLPPTRSSARERRPPHATRRRRPSTSEEDGGAHAGKGWGQTGGRKSVSRMVRVRLCSNALRFASATIGWRVREDGTNEPRATMRVERPPPPGGATEPNGDAGAPPGPTPPRVWRAARARARPSAPPGPTSSPSSRANVLARSFTTQRPRPPRGLCVGPTRANTPRRGARSPSPR